MSRRPHRSSLAIAFAVAALLVIALPRAAAAEPSATPAGHAHGSATSAASATAVSSVPRASGSSAPPVSGSPAPPVSGSSAPLGSAMPDGRDVCTLTGLVRTDGSRCPGAGRLRRQIFGIPNPVPLIPNPVNVIKKVAGGAAKTAFKVVALVVLVGWVASGAEAALKDTAKVIGSSTKPELTSSWFSASYWRVAAIAALLTLPFLCAAAIHALVRSDLGLLTRAAFGYLPLSLLAVGIASQLTMLLLSATDEMSAIISSASGNADGVFLAKTSVAAVAASIADADPFVAFLAAIITVAAALTLWVELLVRDAAVYVIVLMLPLFFAAMVWPARRTLAIRAIETLIALILSKFAIIAVLALGGAALGHSSIPGPAEMLTGATLVLLAAFSPWALLRVLPLHEVASAAAGGLSQGLKQAAMTAADAPVRLAGNAAAASTEGAEWLRSRMPSQAQSLLDGSRDRDAHRAAARSRPEPAVDPVEPADSGADLEPVAAGAVGGALAGDRSAGGDDDAGTGEWPWPQRSSAAPGADTGTRLGAGAGMDADTGTRLGAGMDAGAGAGDAGGPVDAGHRRDGSGAGGQNAGRLDAGAGTAGREPDDETFPYARLPDHPLHAFEDDLRALADLADARDRTPDSAAGSPQAPPDETAVEPPPLPEQDPTGPAPPPPGQDPTGLPAPPPADDPTGPPVPLPADDPTGLPAPPPADDPTGPPAPPPGYDHEPAGDGGDGRAG